MEVKRMKFKDLVELNLRYSNETIIELYVCDVYNAPKHYFELIKIKEALHFKEYDVVGFIDYTVYLKDVK